MWLSPGLSLELLSLPARLPFPDTLPAIISLLQDFLKPARGVGEHTRNVNPSWIHSSITPASLTAAFWEESVSLRPRLYWTRDKNTKSSNTTKRKKFYTWRRGWPTLG